jgi:hypothetical protein
MKYRKVINKKLDDSSDGVNVAGGINAVIAANINEPGTTHTSVSSKQTIVQKNGKTYVHEEESREEA